jgi:hypothetical protein
VKIKSAKVSQYFFFVGGFYQLRQQRDGSLAPASPYNVFASIGVPFFPCFLLPGIEEKIPVSGC